MAEGKYDEAAEGFKALGDFKDSEDMVYEVKYNETFGYGSDGDYDTA